MKRMRVVTERTERDGWRVRVVESDGWFAYGGWCLEATPNGIFVGWPFAGTVFPSRKAAREGLRQYMAIFSTKVRVTGGLH